MASWLAIIGTIVVAAVVKVLSDDLRETVCWLRKRIIRAAKKRLPNEVRERFSEEWDADLSDKPGEVARLVWAIGCYFSTNEIGTLVASKATRSFSVNFAERILSRAINLVLSPALLIMLVPVFVVFGYLVRREGPIFERVERVGRFGIRFVQIRFRTYKSASCGGANFTQVGEYLKRNSMDLLPSLINIFMGHMSLIGPRPRTMDQLNRLRTDYREIYLRVRPGLLSPLALLDTIDETDAEHFEFEYFLQATPLAHLHLAYRAIRLVLRGKPGAFQTEV